MRQASKRISERAEKTVGDIRRATHRHHSTEEKIRIVEGLRGEDSITYPPFMVVSLPAYVSTTKNSATEVVTDLLQ
jgi:hypothetical protein